MLDSSAHSPFLGDMHPARSATAATRRGDPPAGFVGSVGPGDNWEPGPVPFRFQFGDLVLASVPLTLYRRSATLSEDQLSRGQLPKPPPSLDGTAGYVVWSHPLVSRLPVLARRGDKLVYAPRQYRRFSVALSGTFDDYMAGFSGKTRTGLKRKLRKFQKISQGEIDWRVYRTSEQLGEFFRLAKSLAAKTYQARLHNRGLPSNCEFIEGAQGLAERDQVRAYLLLVRDEPVSYLYCPAHEGVLSYDYLGYDPAYAGSSPGTVLQLLTLESLFEEQRFRLFDFTEGEGQHKELFSTASRLCADIYVIKWRLAPVLLVALHRAMELTAGLIGTTLERLHLKSSVRRLIRGV